jgi:hypothetical protein
MEKYPAKGAAESRTSRLRESTDRAREGQAKRPAQRGPRPEGKRSWQSKERFDRPSFSGRAERPVGRKPWPEKRSARTPFGGPERSSQTRTPRTGEGFKPREGRSFGGRAASPGQRGPRPEAKRPWSGTRSDRPSFGGRAERPEGRKPWPEKRSARTPFGGPERSFQTRTPRTGEGFKPREGRSFGGRAASPGQRGPRPEGKRPWSAEKGTSSTGARVSRPQPGGRRSSGPKTGWARPGNDRDKKGRGPRRRS